MEGRYKIFIIDEAHMLSKSAFNALLKTLEEPPSHVVFIFATTEVHRFPATILSRCQVFSFHHLTEALLAGHLADVLKKEQIPFEDEAVRLIARRAAGSVRDSMSLLDQTLAYGSENLTAGLVRDVLGLAGQDALKELFASLAAQDCAKTALFCRTLAGREVDLGFFVRELADTLRSLFLLRQCGKDSLTQLGATENEIAFYENVAPSFTAGYLHAAWQMVLESQRSITTSQEPAASLELLLVNLAFLQQLLPAALAGVRVPTADAQKEMPPHPTRAPAGN